MIGSIHGWGTKKGKKDLRTVFTNNIYMKQIEVRKIE